MKYLLYLLTSVCILLLLGCLSYFALLAIITLTALLEGYMLLLALLLSIAGWLMLRRSLALLRQRQVALATITRLTLEGNGKRTYQLQFVTRADQTVLVELSSDHSSPWTRLQTLFFDLYDAHPNRGSRFPLLYDIHSPDKQPRRLSFIPLWLGPILLFWFSVLLLLLGVTSWLSH